MRKTILLLIIFFCQDIYSQFFWTELNSGVTTQLTSASNIDGFRMWVCGYNGVVLKSTNTGYNWQSLGGGGIPNTVSLVNIYANDDQLALTAGFIGTTTFVYRTSNYGANWTQVFSQPNGNINSICLSSATNGIMVGNPVAGRWSIWKTTNGGLNWDSSGMYLPETATITGLKNSLFVNGTMMWFGTSLSKIYYSSNNGSNWSAIPTPVPMSVYSIAFDLSPMIGLASGENLIRSTNGGFNWSVITVPGSGIINTVGGDRYLNFTWFIRNDNNIYFSYYGTNWSLQYTAPSGNFSYMSFSRTNISNPGGVIAVRSNGGISRCSGSIEGVKLISNDLPSDFRLYQNYPNPFNSTTKIRFETPVYKEKHPGEMRGYLIRIVVYDYLGRELETLVKEIIQAGTYEDYWYGNNYPTGVYFYRLTFEDPSNISGGVILKSITKKMILMK